MSAQLGWQPYWCIVPLDIFILTINIVTLFNRKSSFVLQPETPNNATCSIYAILGIYPMTEISVSHDQPLKTLFIAPNTDTLAVTDKDFRHGVNSENCVCFT